MAEGSQHTEGAFQRSGMMQRTPPSEKPTPISGNGISIGESSSGVSGSVDSENQKDSTPVIAAQITRSELAKSAEESEFERCEEAFKRIRLAMTKQRNISADVTNGINILQDAVLTLKMLHENRASSLKVQQEQSAVAAQAISKKKRGPSSPIAQDEVKKARGGEALKPQPKSAGEWKVAQSKRTSQKKKKEAKADEPKNVKKVKKRAQKPKTEALLIKPQQGKTYAEVLGQLGKAVSRDADDTNIKSVRQTRSGAVLVEFAPSASIQDQFRESVVSALGDMAKVNSLVPTASLEIRDLDCLTTVEEVTAAIRKGVPDIGQIRVGLTSANSRMQRAAIVDVEERWAAKLMQVEKLKIGWVVCRIRRRTAVTRCYRCLSFGHIARNCKGPDNGSLCRKCGKAGHLAKACTGEAHCLPCSDAKFGAERLTHLAGTGQCLVFREALKKAKESGRI